MSREDGKVSESIAKFLYEETLTAEEQAELRNGLSSASKGESLSFDPLLSPIQIDTSLVTAVTPGPVDPAQAATERSAINAAYPKSYLFNGVNMLANAAKWLLAQGSDFIASGGATSSVRSQGEARAGNQWWANGLIEFETDATKICIVSWGQSAITTSFIVDGTLVTADSVTANLPNGSGNREMWFQIEFPDRRPRRLAIACSIREIRLDAGSTLWKALPVPRMKMIGDSFAAALAGPTETSLPHYSSSNTRRLAARVARVLGMHIPIFSCRGGTGFITENLPNDTNYLNRLAQESGDDKVNLVWFWGSSNDASQPEADFKAQVQACIDLAKAKFPSAVILISSLLDGFAGSTPATTYSAYLKAVCDANPGVLFLPVNAALRGDEGYIYGTGRVGATTGDGNADIYLGSGTADRHWNDAAIDYAAVRFAADIRKLLS